jgi:predicted HicB family RNase H-like nuclease
MSTTKAQQKAVSKYMKKNYDVFQIRMPKGEKDKIKEYANAHGESINGFIRRAINETMEKSP